MQSNDFDKAWERVSHFLKPTPLIRSDWLSDLTGGNVYLKLECLNLGHSFKIRGALNSILSFPKIPSKVITASGGNHGLGVAIASKLLGIKCRIYLPEKTPESRIRLLEEMNAEVILFGEAWDESDMEARRIAKETNIPYIHAFAQKEVFLGQGTIIRELQQQIAKIDALVASVGGGGLMSGLITTAKYLDMDIDFYSVETKGADSFYRSFKAGRIMELDKIASIANTLGAKKTTPEIFEILRNGISEAFVVDDAKAVRDLEEFLNIEKILIEPAASCIISALKEHKDLFRNKNVVLIICGSNISLNDFLKWKKLFQ